MRRLGVAVLLVGLVLTFSWCAIFPSQYGSDYAAINVGGPIGTAAGVLLLVFGLVLLGGGRGGPDTWRPR